MTEEEGEAYCKVICDTHPEVFDEEKGEFIGAEATLPAACKLDIMVAEDTLMTDVGQAASA